MAGRGRPKTGGRKRGVPNKLTATLKDMVLAALKDAGGQKYLAQQAKENPAAFMTLLGKILPTQVTGNDGGPIAMTSHGIDMPTRPETPEEWLARRKKELSTVVAAGASGHQQH